MAQSFIPARTGYSRVFLIDGRARPDHELEYQSNMKAGAISQSFGDVEKIEVPSPTEWGKFIEVGQIRGQEERATVTLTGRYASDLRSELLRLARQGCSVDVHVNFGTCTDPSDGNVYTKKLILEDALLTSFSTEDIGALGSDENAKIDESAEVSARVVYEILPISFSIRDESTIVTPIVGATFCGNPTCGECDEESTGCEFIGVVTSGSSGSPGVTATLVYSNDGGATLFPADFTGLTADPVGVACYEGYVVVPAGTGVQFILSTDLDESTGPNPAFSASSYSLSQATSAISAYNGGAFISAAAGTVYRSTNPSQAPSEFATGTVEDLNDISSLDENVAVAVGDNGAVVVTTGSDLWGVVNGVDQGTDNNTAVEVIEDDIWFVGDDQGVLRYTINGGNNWATIALPDVSAVPITSISFANRSVGYLTKGTDVFMTNDGGNTWFFAPNESGETIPSNAGMNVVAACDHQADTIVAGGIATGGVDGILLIG